MSAVDGYGYRITVDGSGVHDPHVSTYKPSRFTIYNRNRVMLDMIGNSLSSFLVPCLWNRTVIPFDPQKLRRMKQFNDKNNNDSL